MSPTGLYPLRLLQFGIETPGQGDPSAATKKIEGVGVWGEDDVRFRREYPTGVRLPNDDGGVTVRKGAILSHSAPLDYEQIIYALLCSVVNDAVPLGSDPYTWQFPADTTAKPTVKTVTAEFVVRDGSGGADLFEREAQFGICRRIMITITPGEIATVETDWFFRASQGSSFTTSLSPISGRADVPSSLFKLAIDSSWANLGNTNQSPGFRSATIEILPGLLPAFGAEQRSDLDFTSLLAGMFNVNVSVTTEHNTQAAVEVAAARDNTVRFYQFNANNGGAGTANRQITIQLALKHLEFPVFSEEEGIELVTYSLGLEYDATGSQGFNMEVINLEDYDPELYPRGEVILKESRTLGDRKRLESSAAKRISTTRQEAQKGDEGEHWQAVDFDEISCVLFEISVESWTLDLPLTRVSWAGLDEDFGDWLEDQILGYYRDRAEAAEERRKARSGQSAKSGGEPAKAVSQESQPSTV